MHTELVTLVFLGDEGTEEGRWRDFHYFSVFFVTVLYSTKY